MLRIARATQSPMIISVRDPRDAVCSLMDRFGMDFNHAVAFVTSSANALSTLDGVSLVLRYEEDFVSKAATVQSIAELVGTTCDETECTRIFAALTPEEVTTHLKALEENGTFDPDQPAIQQFDPGTHWHPSHLGDGRSGKWQEQLTAAENAEIVRCNRQFLDRYGYKRELRTMNAGEATRFNAGAEGIGWLVTGFSTPEDWGTWTCERQATLRIDLATQMSAWLSVEIDCRLGPSFTPDCGATATLSLNGQSLSRIGSQEGGYVLHISLYVKGRAIVGCDSVEIVITFEGLRPPRELGAGTDERLVGIGLSALSLNFA